jgi:hypothetical protein
VTTTELTTPLAAPAPSRARLAARRLLFMGLGLALALLGAEVALRLLKLAPPEGIGTVNMKDFERLPGIFSPGQHVRDVQKPALPYTVAIDSLGFRGADFPRVKPADQLRVLVVGDSYVYGDFVEENQTFPFQLEERLRRACPNALVINAGLGGTTITDHAHMMQRALSLAPDLVILVYVFDDIDNLSDSQGSWARLGENRRQKSRFPLSVMYPLVRNTALWNLVVRARAARSNVQGATALLEAKTQDSVAIATNLRARYSEALVAIRDTLKARGVPLLLAMYPAWVEVKTPSDNLKWVERFAATQGIAGVNLQPALARANLAPEQLYLLPHDGHPGPRGYAITADTVATEVLRSAAARSCRPS